MADVRVTLNSEGVRELLRSAELQNACLEEANRIAAEAGEGYEVSTITYPERAGARVYAETKEAMRDAYENNTLLYAIGR